MTPPIRKYRVTYRMVLSPRSIIIEATSKYNAKERFYKKYPRYEILSVEVVSDG